MNDITMVYSAERGTWNVIFNGEWYYEGTYEECVDTMMCLYDCEE